MLQRIFILVFAISEKSIEEVNSIFNLQSN